LKAIFATTELSAFGSIDAPEPNARAMDLYRVAADNARLAGKSAASKGPVAANKAAISAMQAMGLSEAVLHSTDTSTNTAVIKPDWVHQGVNS
jgi:hypothetical protein